ncbi:Outer membrane protein beta-barrel domain-containing protein [Arenibacter palladensis]|uniref:Outer membrane protein beta-barrel domain-containing protein n=1 Tax=Arenibacter palladensis TaxID=237373 RepID=A0A1M5GL32_9FLAO|nr:porin family protein [Arenibacter palladensis]SHG04470.1 Outer membrane protein beta-barrel domain-containing protein [Arenibacter palladensis]|tara:strand:+ start:2011 stop:2706 length:696 start_codon:yes stop_codon:yes gene_type:complete
MKNIFVLFIVFCALGNTAIAQFNEKPVMNLENEDKPLLNWGYFLGFNQYDFKFEYKDDLPDILVDKSFGFNVGLIGELRLNKFLDLRFEPGLHYNQRNLGFPGFDNERDAIREVKSTYINFPLLLKVSTKRLGNWKPFLVGGASTSLNLGSNEQSLDDNSSATFRMKKTTYYYEMGFGIDFYLEYFKFTPSIRGVFAINDELIRDNDPNSPWTGNVEAMMTRGLFVNFTFE